jgi:hypothetical protein
MKRILIPVFMLVSFLGPMMLYSQVKPDFKALDSLTYRLYLEKKWDSLVITGKQALHGNLDYYYLRARLGIACFEKRQYITAISHLTKARQFNSGDPLLAEYLYYALLYANRKEDAMVLWSSLTDEAKKKTSLINGIVQEVHLEGGYTISSDRSPGNLSDLSGKDSLYGEQDLYGNNTYGNIGLKLRISRRIGLMLSYNYFNFSKTKYFQYGRYEDHFLGTADSTWGRDYLYSFPFVRYDTSFRYNVHQNDFHLGITIGLPGGFKVMPAFHLINVHHTLINAKFSMNTVQDTDYYKKKHDSTFFFPFDRVSYTYDQNDTSFYNYLVGLNITKDWGIFNIGLSGSWSNLNHKKQKQAGIALTYYPMGNLDFYGITTVTGLFQGKDKRLLLGQVLGAKITPWLWMEGNIYYGDYTNANIFNGSIVYNNTDKMDYNAGASLIFLTKKHIQFSLIYQYYKKESQQFIYDETSGRLNIQNNPYNTQSIIGGITWKL